MFNWKPTATETATRICGEHRSAVDLLENMETLLTKAEEYFLIAKLAPDKGIAQRYEDMAQELRHRFAEVVGGGSVGGV